MVLFATGCVDSHDYTNVDSHDSNVETTSPQVVTPPAYYTPYNASQSSCWESDYKVGEALRQRFPNTRIHLGSDAYSLPLTFTAEGMTIKVYPGGEGLLHVWTSRLGQPSTIWLN